MLILHQNHRKEAAGSPCYGYPESDEVCALRVAEFLPESNTFHKKKAATILDPLFWRDRQIIFKEARNNYILNILIKMFFMYIQLPSTLI